jgi:hypothetical protein
MPQPNIEKIQKEIDKADAKELPALFNEIKSYIFGKLISKTKEYQELLEKFNSVTENGEAAAYKSTTT